MAVTINVSAFLKSWETMQNRMDANGQTAWRNAVREAWDSQREHGYQNKTGRLTASMSWKTSQRGKFNWAGRLKTSAPYAVYVDSGTGIYGRGTPIVPIRAKFLRFWIGPRLVFAKSVKGFKGAKFTNNARGIFENNAPSWVQKALDSAVR